MTVKRNQQQRQQQFPGVGVDEDGGGEQADRQHKLGLRDRDQVAGTGPASVLREGPAGDEVGQPAQGPDQQVALAKGAENQQAGGQQDQRGRLLWASDRGQ